MEVLPRRRQFYEVAWWYLPLFLGCILPLGVRGVRNGSIDPPALVTMGLLAVMLFIISVVADLGILERLLPAVVGAVGLGALIGTLKAMMAPESTVQTSEVILMSLLGTPLSLFVVLQLLTASRWRFWAVGLALTCAGATIALAR